MVTRVSTIPHVDRATRRQVAAAAAWTVPVVDIACTAPAYAASPTRNAGIALTPPTHSFGSASFGCATTRSRTPSTEFRS